MDRALIALAETQLPPSALREVGELAHEYGLAPERMAMTHVWRMPGEWRCSVATKGAPEAQAALCGLSAERAAAARAQADAMGERGLHVLGVACARFEGDAWPADPAAFGFEWLGLVALADPLRAGVREAVQECREAGIRVLMLTGDHPVTACAIAAQAGIAADAVYARVTPERKLVLVESPKAQGEIVAMTGDGVNDAPR
jgi:Ca2+-transporting ATPase